MADNIHTKEFMEQARTLITTDQPIGGGNMSLKVVDLQNIAMFVAREDLSNHLPAVLIEPQDVINPELQDLQPTRHLLNYRLRLLLVDEYTDNERPMEVKVDLMKHLANVFMRNPSRFTPPEAHATVLFSQVTEIDYKAEEEDALVRAVSEHIWAASLVLEIQTSTQRIA